MPNSKLTSQAKLGLVGWGQGAHNSAVELMEQSQAANPTSETFLFNIYITQRVQYFPHSMRRLYL